MGDLYAGQGSMCPFVCILLSQLFQDLKKQRRLEGEAKSSRTKFGSGSPALGSKERRLETWIGGCLAHIPTHIDTHLLGSDT